MTLDLAGKTAFITGSAKGIGASIALFLAKQGATIILHYLSSKKEAEETLQKIQKHAPDSMIVQGNLTDSDEVDRLFLETFRRHPKIDILINTVGPYVSKKSLDHTAQDYREVIASNLLAPFYCVKKVLPGMLAFKGGKIINFGAIAPKEELSSTPYYVAKEALWKLTRAWASELSGRGVTVNMISMGTTEVSESIQGLPKNELKKREVVTLKEINQAVAHFLLPGNSQITGFNVALKGECA